MRIDMKPGPRIRCALRKAAHGIQSQGRTGITPEMRRVEIVTLGYSRQTSFGAWMHMC